MKVAILGAGGMGRALAALLERSGHEVTLAFRNAEDAEALNEAGVVVTGVADMVARPHCTADALRGSYDVLMMATKTYDSAAAVGRVRDIAVDVALSVQNGMGKDEVVRAIAPGRVLGAVIQITSTRTAVGVRITAIEPSFLGEIDGTRSHRARDLARAFTAARIPTTVVEDITAIEWTKLASWIPSSLLSVVTGRPLPEIVRDPDLSELFIDMAREIGRVASADGHPIIEAGSLVGAALAVEHRDAGRAALLRMARVLTSDATVPYRSSMLLDLEAGRPLELEDTAGHLLRVAGEKGIDLPVTHTLVGLARAVATSGARPA